MAGQGWTRQWAAAAFALCAAAVTGGEEKGGMQGMQAPCRFNSKLAFLVWAQVAEGQPSSAIGETPSAQPVAVPACRMWWVQPLGKLDMLAVVAEVKAQKIPGLRLPSSATVGDVAHLKDLKDLQSLSLALTGVTDAGLVSLNDLKALRELWLMGTKVSDAGLAHLKGLAGLQLLDLWATKVTDAGLPNLKAMKALRTLNLRDTQVTDAGVSELEKWLPGLNVVR